MIQEWVADRLALVGRGPLNCFRCMDRRGGGPQPSAGSE